MSTDYRGMYDREYIGAWDIPKGKDAIVEIARVECKELVSNRGKNKKPIVYFVGKDKAFVCNKTNGKAIAGMYGNDTKEWAGKKIALYSTTTSSGGEMVDCIRVRPTPPQ